MHVTQKGFSEVLDRNFYRQLKPRTPVALQALDELGVALADHGHKWTPTQRRLYERATRSLLRR